MWAVALRGFLATSAPTFLPKAANSGWGVNTHTHTLAVSQGMLVEGMTFVNALGEGWLSWQGLERSALGEQKVFGVQQWFSLHYRNQHCALYIPSLALSAECCIWGRLGQGVLQNGSPAPCLPD